MVERGITYCTGCFASCAAIASLSYVSSTSPLPERNVLSALRALESWTSTFLNSVSRFACACFGVLPCLIQAPYAAMTFQRAPPEVNGFGVITEMPGLSRSFQVLMCLG